MTTTDQPGVWMAVEPGVWMAVEVMGHRQHVGIVREVSRFGATFCEIDELQRDGTFKRLAYGGSAIFSHREVSEEDCRRQVLPKGWSACATFKSSRVLPVACEDCGFEEAKHQPAKALPAHEDADMAVDSDRGGDGAFDVEASIARLRTEMVGKDPDVSETARGVELALMVGIHTAHEMKLVLAALGWPETSATWGRVMGLEMSGDDADGPASIPDHELAAASGGYL